jgi:hypothetical protein
MHKLSRICVQNWYLIDALDVNVRGSAAFVGPTGSGKSSLQDAIQTVIQGVNHNRLELNQSASGKSERTVLEYCLGMTKDPSEGGKPLRDSCETIIALVFEDSETGEPLTAGIALSARFSDSREEVLSRFIMPGYAYSVDQARRREGSQQYLAPWSELCDQLRAACPRFEEYKTSGEKFVHDMLKLMRGPYQVPNVKHFQRTFSNALAFKPIFDSTNFVREFVLDSDPLDVTRVRTSITTWQDLEKIIQDIEAKLRRVSRLAERYRNWGRAKLRAEGSRLAAAVAESRRAAHDVVGHGEVLRRKSDELRQARSGLTTRRQWARELDEELRAKQVLASAGGEAARMRQIDLEAQWLERDRKDAEQRFSSLRGGLSDLAQLAAVRDEMTPKQSRAVAAAQEALSSIPAGRSAAEALKGRGERLTELVEEALTVEGLEIVLHERADQLADELRLLQTEAERLDAVVASAGGGAAILSQPASRLLAALDRKGMRPVPLCDVVDIVDEEWQYAVESLLGRGREAIIVPPERLTEAFDLMYRERDQYSGCTLVKTNVTRPGRARAEANSILEAVTSENPHAIAFMNVRIGSFQKAYSEDELSVMDRAVMRNGKTSSSMGLSVQANLRELVLGRSARAKTAETLRNDLAPLKTKLEEGRRRLRLLRDAVRILPSAVASIQQAQSPYDLEHSLQTLSTRIASLERTRNDDIGRDAREIVDEITSMETDRQAYLKEIAEEFEPAVERLQGEVATARAKTEAAMDVLRKSVKERRKVWVSLSGEELQKLVDLDPEIDEPRAIGVLRRIRADIARGEAEKKDARQWLASMRNDNRLIADNGDAEARREQSAAIRETSEYAVNWNAEVPEVGVDSMTVGYVWAVAEKARLEMNELRRYQAECERASKEMRRMLKEDLLARLAEKLVKVHHRVERLNTYLSAHVFTHQTYSLETHVNQAFARMHDLAMKIGGQQAGEVIALEDKEIAEAVKELESMIAGEEDAKTLADYRQYFTFEIVMTDRSGGRTTMSTRAVKGSGGEAQAPFYVLLAVALASTYFPGHITGNPTGMGLAMFDEAFNKLDVPNTQALVRLFESMGLQLLIAGPEDKRATFTEVLPTIILVNKNLDATAVYIDAEYPKEKARAALAEINPEHRGVESFRMAAIPAAE